MLAAKVKFAMYGKDGMEEVRELIMRAAKALRDTGMTHQDVYPIASQWTKILYWNDIANKIQSDLQAHGISVHWCIQSELPK